MELIPSLSVIEAAITRNGIQNIEQNDQDQHVLGASLEGGFGHVRISPIIQNISSVTVFGTSLSGFGSRGEAKWMEIRQRRLQRQDSKK